MGMGNILIDDESIQNGRPGPIRSRLALGRMGRRSRFEEFNYASVRITNGISVKEIVLPPSLEAPPMDQFF